VNVPQLAAETVRLWESPEQMLAVEGMDEPNEVTFARTVLVLIRAGDVLATRLDETPAPDAYLRGDLDNEEFKQRQQAVRAWLAIAHPNGKGHVDATTVGERGERAGMTWDEATE
jgi:hypothetical protein